MHYLTEAGVNFLNEKNYKFPHSAWIPDPTDPNPLLRLKTPGELAVAGLPSDERRSSNQPGHEERMKAHQKRIDVRVKANKKYGREDEDFNSPIRDFKDSDDREIQRILAPDKNDPPRKRRVFNKRADADLVVGQPFGRTVWTGLGDSYKVKHDRMIASEKGMTPAQIKRMNTIKAEKQAAQHDTRERIHPAKMAKTRKTPFDKLPKEPDVFYPGNPQFDRWAKWDK